MSGQTLATEIVINASAHTVWAILDDVDRYPEWKPLVPDIAGRTTVDEVLTIRLVQGGMPDLHLTPKIARIVGARELRWVSSLPNPEELTGEHVFKLTPLDEARCHLHHYEIFKGTLVEPMWPAIDTAARAAYEGMNQALKMRAESLSSAPVSIHPVVEREWREPSGSFEGATLRCRCTSDPVEVHLFEPIQHNHLCGCSKCWKTDGSLFALIAVVPKGSATVAKNAAALKVVDTSQAIQRHACARCGTHMIARVEDTAHHFYGLEFVHPELSADTKWPRPEFAGFVSSLIETGTSPSSMAAVRTCLYQLGLEAYDAFSPELMDMIAWHKRKLLA